MQRAKDRWGSYEWKRLRVVVSRWDDRYIYATPRERQSENPKKTELQICYGSENEYLSRGGKGEWSYLSSILAEGTQLNLVRIRRQGDILFPELIIFEPDYLINITTIASCFESYAESPFVNLVNKIKPRANTIPIHLGNLAGAFLDDTVHQRDISFEESLHRFISHNSLEMVACHEMADHGAFATFVSDARQQKENIERLVGNDLPSVIEGYDSEEVLLEPSFISELLGIQGRMDLLHEGSDGNVLIVEQKSGKGDFSPNADPTIPIPQEKHLVQVLLYRALLAYGFDKFADQMQHTMLLYSKYPKGLVDAGSHPELLLRAFRIRNLLAWCELSYAEEGFRRLRTLTPEALNRKKLTGRLWDGYVRPQLQELLLPISRASHLEQEYYLRFLRFIATEQKLAKLGNGTEDTPGFASVWNSTLEEKQEAGNIITGLVPTSESPATTKQNSTSISTITYLLPCENAEKAPRESTNGSGSAASLGSFRTGDIVMLYPYKAGKTPDACAQMVERATITRISATEITLRLRNARKGKAVETPTDGTLWAVEHDLFDSSTGGLYTSMHAFLSAPKTRKDLLLCQRQPTIDTSLQPKGDYGAFNELVRRAKQARDLFMVIGPPGTGKTSFGLVNLLHEELLEPESNILLLSYTNRAVDEICGKLEHHGHDYIRIGSEMSCPEEYRSRLLTRKTAKCESGNEVSRMLRSTRIFCGTAASLNAAISLFEIKRFSLAIIDEASQILEPHLMGIISARRGESVAVERFVLIGDHKQLPAVVQQSAGESMVEEEALRAIGLTDCRRSLFERMLATYRNTPLVYMLTKQGRMHPDIADFPNQAFYGGKLDVVPLPHQRVSPTKSEYRVSFQAVRDDGTAKSLKANLAEARIIAQRVREIYEAAGESFSTDSTIGVIVPYRNQIAVIRREIDSYGIAELHDITIDTVERYQGSQRDYILYGFTVRQRQQLNFLAGTAFEEDGMTIDRKLNVAMTRARLRLCLFGNPDILRWNTTFRELMDFLKERGAFIP